MNIIFPVLIFCGDSFPGNIFVGFYGIQMETLVDNKNRGSFPFTNNTSIGVKTGLPADCRPAYTLINIPSLKLNTIFLYNSNQTDVIGKHLLMADSNSFTKSININTIQFFTVTKFSKVLKQNNSVVCTTMINDNIGLVVCAIYCVQNPIVNDSSMTDKFFIQLTNFITRDKRGRI